MKKYLKYFIFVLILLAGVSAKPHQSSAVFVYNDPFKIEYIVSDPPTIYPQNEVIKLPITSVSAHAKVEDNGQVVKTEWYFLSGPKTAVVKNITLTPKLPVDSTVMRADLSGMTDPGEYVFYLGATDDDDESTGTNLTVTVVKSPTVTLTADPDNGIAGSVNPTLKWVTSNDPYPDSCTATGDWIKKGNKEVKGGSDSQGILNQIKTYNYTIKCKFGTETVSDSATVVVKGEIPTVTTPTATNINQTSATLGATVTSLGMPAELSAQGTCYSTSEKPSLINGAKCLNTTVSKSVPSIFTHNRTQFIADTLYYYTGYAANATGTSYSPDGTFTTAKSVAVVAVVPIVTTAPVLKSSIGETYATSGVSIENNSGAVVKVSGIFWSKFPTKNNVNDNDNLGKTTNGGTIGGPWPGYMSGLEPNTKYYVKAYATNSVDTYYGDNVLFKTTKKIVSNNPDCGSTKYSCINGSSLMPNSDSIIKPNYVWNCTGVAQQCFAPLKQCQDGIDNDKDLKIDYPADLGCTSLTDDTEGDIKINVIEQ